MSQVPFISREDLIGRVNDLLGGQAFTLATPLQRNDEVIEFTIRLYQGGVQVIITSASTDWALNPENYVGILFSLGSPQGLYRARYLQQLLVGVFFPGHTAIGNYTLTLQ